MDASVECIIVRSRALLTVESVDPTWLHAMHTCKVRLREQRVSEPAGLSDVDSGLYE